MGSEVCVLDGSSRSVVVGRRGAPVPPRPLRGPGARRVRAPLGLASSALRTREDRPARAAHGVVSYEMEKSNSRSPIQPDSLESAINQVVGIVGAFLVATVGAKAFGGRPEMLWLGVLIALLVVSSFGESLLPATYSGFVFGLIYNGFFVGSDVGLRFDRGSDWLLEVIFIATGVAAAGVGYMIRRTKAGLRDAPTHPPELSKAYLWESNGSAGRSRRHRWTR
jgi:K+-sensing histidine kinase KdpD